MIDKNQHGIGSTVTILLIVLILGIGFSGWYVVRHRQNKPDVHSSQQVTGNSTDSDANKDISQAPAQKYMDIKEWGVRVPVNKTDNDDDMTYSYKKTDIGEYVYFTFQRLIDHGICKTDIGVAMSRSTEKTSPPYSIDNPEQIAHVAGYYYSTSYGGSYCYDSENPVETAFYKSTNITSLTVTDALKKLEPIPAQ